MAKLRVHNLSMSLDGFVAGADQGVDNPLGVGGEQLHEWMFATRMWGRMVGTGEGSTGLDNEFAERGEENIGAHVRGRNMFGPIGGDWGDEQWKGWWGDDPPYHNDVFILTHHPREPVEMQGGTTYHFVTDGIERALERAKESADGQDVMLWGGAQIINQYLAAGLLDELELHIVPMLLGGGARLFDNLGGAEIKLEQVRAVQAPGVTHVKYRVTT